MYSTFETSYDPLPLDPEKNVIKDEENLDINKILFY